MSLGEIWFVVVQLLRQALGAPGVVVVQTGQRAPWEPYVPIAAAGLSSVVAVTIALMVQQRALKHDRKVRRHDDARRALADAIEACDDLGEAIEQCAVNLDDWWYYQVLETERQGSPRRFQKPDDWERLEALANELQSSFRSSLAKAKSRCRRAMMFFGEGTAVTTRLLDVVAAQYQAYLELHDAGPLSDDKRQAAIDAAVDRSGMAIEDLRAIGMRFARGDLDIDSTDDPAPMADSDALAARVNEAS
jgi:uncharacterized membrane protein